MPDILQPTAMKSAYKIVVLFIFSSSIMVEGSNPREPNRNEITHQRRETTGGLTGVISHLPLENKMGKKTLRLFLIHSQFAAPSWPLGLGPKVKNGRINKIPRIQLHLWKPGKKFDQKKLILMSRVAFETFPEAQRTQKLTPWLGLREGFNKHRKNCECCPVSQLIVR